MLAVKQFAHELGIEWRTRKECSAEIAHNEKYILVQPRLFMNENGGAVRSCLKVFDLKPTSVLVIHDDLERQFGRVSKKLKGSASGHNGVRSVIASIKTDSFERIRVGISRPVNQSQVFKYVLENFNPDERDILYNQVFEDVFKHIEKFQQAKTM